MKYAQRVMFRILCEYPDTEVEYSSYGTISSFESFLNVVEWEGVHSPCELIEPGLLVYSYSGREFLGMPDTVFTDRSGQKIAYYEEQPE